MGLSNDLISQFAKITKTSKDEKKETTAYGTMVDYGGSAYVRLDGSDLLTPITTTVEAKPGDRVTVLLKNHTATVTGNITSPAVRTETVNVVVKNIEDVNEVLADVVTTDSLNVLKAQISDLEAENATITESLNANSASISDLESNNAVINNTLSANEASIAELQAADVTINGRLDANEAAIANLKVDMLDAGTIQATYATIESLNATNVNVSDLTADVADIDTLIFGSASGNVIQTSFSNAVIAQLGNAQIKSAMIDSVSAGKITSGDIITNNVRVLSEDGSLIISDETMQISDGTRVRVQIGKDAADDYSINIWDQNGELMFSKGGITDKAIKDAIIRNDMVSDTANIAAHKLDIDSLFEEINGSTNTINATKVYLDEEGQTLDVAFKSLSSTVTDQGTTITSQGTAISTIQGQISSKIWQEDINTASGEMSTQYSTLSQELDSLSTTVANHTTQISAKADNSTVTTVSNKVSSLETNLSGFQTTVSETYATKTALAATDTKADNAQSSADAAQDSVDSLEIGGRNLLLDSAKERTAAREYVSVDITSIVKDYADTGQTFSVSADVTAAIDGGVNMYALGKYEFRNPRTTSASIVAGEYTRMKLEGLTVVYNSEGQNGEVCNLSFYGVYDTGVIPIVKNIKVELGNRCTDYTVAPEDVDSDIENAQASADAAQADVDALTIRVTNAETAISQNSEAIALRATKTEVSTAKSEAISAASQDATTKANTALSSANANTESLLEDYSTTSEMNAAIQLKADSITSSVSSTYATKTALSSTDANVAAAQSAADAAQADIDALEIGGRNLLSNSETQRSTTRFLEISTYDIFSDYIGREVTVSFDAIILDGGTSRNLQMYPYQNNGISITGTFYFTPTTEWQRFSYTTTVKDWGIQNSNYTKGSIGVYDYAGVNNYALRRIKIELGNRATDWTPAPEDIDSDISALDTRVTSAESSITQLSDKITSNVTETTNLGTRMTTVEQTASDLTVRMSTAETNVTNAAKTATNFLSYDSTNGLLVGNKSSGSWSGTRAQLKSDAFNVLDSSGTIMASYGTTTTIGKSSANNVYIDSDSIDIRNGTTVLATFDQYGLKIANSNDASGSLGSGTSKPALVIGSESGYHIEMDNNEIMAKSDATTTSHLFLNMEGGNVSVNNNCDRAIMFQDGALYAKNKNYNSGNWLGIVDGLNESGNTTFGYGGYLQEIGATNIYGNDMCLYSKGYVNTNTSFVVRNGYSFQGTNTSGEIRNNLQPCNTNDNCVIGYGSYTAGEGATNIYGKTINLTCDDLKLNGTSYDSGWKTPSISSKLTNYDSNTSNALKYRRVGNIVDVCGAVSPATTSALADGESVTAFTLPTGYRPAYTRTYLCQGSGLCFFMLQIQSGGAVAISRYRSAGSTSYPTSVATTTWLPISATFTID